MSDRDEESVQELLDEKSAFIALKNSEGWRRVIEILDGWAELNFAPCKSIEDVLLQEHSKGRFACACFIRSLPDAKIEEAEAVLDSIKEQEDDEGSDDSY